ncbi:unnamed protein product [Calicophoron daubneyi]|uniref:Uncharacterized protein n=1 Tax=Calicophoron daubneyi TaxID=300641 RepID=A0AAV2TIE7_CALDB
MNLVNRLQSEQNSTGKCTPKAIEDAVGESGCGTQYAIRVHFRTILFWALFMGAGVPILLRLTTYGEPSCYSLIPIYTVTLSVTIIYNVMNKLKQLRRMQIICSDELQGLIQGSHCV